MNGTAIKKWIIGGTLLLLAVSAFYLHVRAYRQSSTRTIDELVFYHLGAQLKSHFPAYHTRRFASLLLQLRPGFAPLPAYFYQPVFKHPPLFAGLIALSLTLFGDSYLSALYVSAFFGACAVFLVFWLGALVFDETVGLLAAFVLWLDPVNIIPAQKIWADTTLSFFMALSACLFLTGLKRISRKGSPDKVRRYWIGFGAAAGLAVLTKYPGIIALLTALVFTSFRARPLLRDRGFRGGLAIPFLMLIPWGAWNYVNFGPGFWKDILAANNLNHFSGLAVAVLLFLGGVGLAVALAAKGSLARLRPLWPSGGSSRSLRLFLGAAGLAVLVAILHRAFAWDYVPATSWIAGQIGKTGVFFYFRHLSGFSLVYALAFVTFLFPLRFGYSDGAAFLKLSAALIMLFYILWGNFQCRYILPATPFLIVLGCALWVRGLRSVQMMNGKNQRRMLLVGVCAVSAFVLLKMYYIDLTVSFPNNMCYY